MSDLLIMPFDRTHSMKRVLFALLLAVLSCNVWSQVASDSTLFRALGAQDRTLFDRAFNHCGFEYLEAAVHPSLRFYHDQGGFQDRQAFLEATRRNICGDPERKPIRKVDPESLEVFPLYAEGALYGAIQRGVHHFYIRTPDGRETPTSSARFTHVYLLQGERWLLAEVLSYDHGEPRSMPVP